MRAEVNDRTSSSATAPSSLSRAKARALVNRRTSAAASACRSPGIVFIVQISRDDQSRHRAFVLVAKRIRSTDVGPGDSDARAQPRQNACLAGPFGNKVE